jgi:hypothetical protein
MLEKLIFEFHELQKDYLWIVICLGFAAAYLTKEMTGRFLYALFSLPVFLAAGIGGACLMQAREMQIGIDRLTDTIAGAMTGMTVLILLILMTKIASAPGR